MHRPRAKGPQGPQPRETRHLLLPRSAIGLNQLCIVLQALNLCHLGWAVAGTPTSTPWVNNQSPRAKQQAAWVSPQAKPKDSNLGRPASCIVT
ncbi:MAG: hypothetical protein ACK559_35545, partial [bacterium]